MCVCVFNARCSIHAPSGIDITRQNITKAKPRQAGIKQWGGGGGADKSCDEIVFSCPCALSRNMTGKHWVKVMNM